MSETTETSVFVCSPEPTDPGCMDAEQPAQPTTTVAVDPTTTTQDTVEVTEVAPVAEPVPMTELPVTGFNGFDLVLLLLAGVLIAVGTDLVRRSRRL